MAFQTGNRQAIILLPWYQLADTQAIAHGTVNWTFRNEALFPIQLQPHESRLIKLKIPLYDIMLNPVKPKHSKSMDTTYTSYLRLEYVAMDSNLQADSAFSDFDVEPITNKKISEVSCCVKTLSGQPWSFIDHC